MWAGSRNPRRFRGATPRASEHELTARLAAQGPGQWSSHLATQCRSSLSLLPSSKQLAIQASLSYTRFPEQAEHSLLLIWTSPLLSGEIFPCRWIVWGLGLYLSVLWVGLSDPFHTEWNITVVQSRECGGPAGAMTPGTARLGSLPAPQGHALPHLPLSTWSELLGGW